MRFEHKSVIITGGGGKIAKAYAMAFANEGATVSLPDVASADPVVKAIKDMGRTAISMTCDVSNEKEEFDKAMAVNVRGSWLCAKAAVPYMQSQKKGRSSIFLPTWHSRVIPTISITSLPRARSSPWPVSWATTISASTR